MLRRGDFVLSPCLWHDARFQIVAFRCYLITSLLAIGVPTVQSASHPALPDLPNESPLPHILSIDSLSGTEIDAIFDAADRLQPFARGQRVSNVLNGAVLVNLFLEASTRTRISFGAAFNRLGGHVRDTTGFQFSSLAKGETLADTARVVSFYADVIVLRHPTEGEVATFSQSSLVPVINAGDGSGEHPTQSLLDLYSIRMQRRQRGGEVAGSTVAFIGDLHFGRTVHSLIRLLMRFESMHFVLCSPDFLGLPSQLLARVKARGHRVTVVDAIPEALAMADIIYITRVQRERFSDRGEFTLPPASFRTTRSMIDQHCLPHAVIFHPLPRDGRPEANDLDPAISDSIDSRVAIFRQADNGIATRMALFLHVFGVGIEAVESTATVPLWKSWKV
ncbi:MAG: aspartate carbamoyltransferase [Alphaproteobacteria bacterium]|nr:aspartate carbamoyltransferase [Alphaproteobacteria bacterium]